jgi:hypothetical protein
MAKTLPNLRVVTWGELQDCPQFSLLTLGDTPYVLMSQGGHPLMFVAGDGHAYGRHGGFMAEEIRSDGSFVLWHYLLDGRTGWSWPKDGGGFHFVTGRDQVPEGVDATETMLDQTPGYWRITVPPRGVLRLSSGKASLMLPAEAIDWMPCTGSPVAPAV